MEKMEERLPQEQTFGYWQTHPFFEERVRAARARQTTLKIQEPDSSDEYRRRSQVALLGFANAGPSPVEAGGAGPSPVGVGGAKASPEVVALIKEAALAAWPRGELAEHLRLDELHARRDEEAAKKPLSRDYGKLLETYRDAEATVRGLTPESPFLSTVAAEIRDLEAERDRTYPEAVAVLEGQIFETPFLETFLSNFPESEPSPRAALALGEAYARLRRETEAVDNFMLAWRRGADSENAERARRGLAVLAPRLDRLAALKTLADQDDDAALKELASRRLATQVSTFAELENGAEFLERYPESDQAAVVEDRQNRLADDLYKEVILYQRMGDNAKAVRGIHRILTLAPLSPAAKRLGESVVAAG
jgi:hypothetical protein